MIFKSPGVAKSAPKSEVQALREEVTSLRRQLSEQKDLTAEYRKLHQSASIRKQELFGAIRKLHGFIEEVME
jgi:hypothetical protein